jgi:hypothetical protein
MVLDCHNPVPKWPNTLGSDMMAKEWDFRDCKLALLLIDDQTSCLEAVDNLLHIPLVLLNGLAGHNDVI